MSRSLIARVAPELSASKLGLASLCGYPWTLEQGWPVDEEAAPEAAFGTAVHRGAELLGYGEPVPPDVFDGLSASDAERARRCIDRIGEWLGDIPGAPYAVERGLRYNLHTGEARFAPRRDRVGYVDVRPGELPMTADLWFRRSNGVHVVADYKTGRPKPADKIQIDTLALAIARLTDAPEIETMLVYVDEQGVCPVRGWLDELDLAEHAARLERLVLALPSRRTPEPGEHCRRDHCPIIGECPAARAALAVVAPALPVGEIASDEQAMQAYIGLPLAEAALEGVRRALIRRVSSHPLTLPDGKVYGLHEQTDRKPRAVTPAVEEAIDRVLGQHAAGVVKTERSFTIGDLERAASELARERKANGLVKKLGEEAERIVRELDGVAFESKPHVRVSARKPRKGE